MLAPQEQEALVEAYCAIDKEIDDLYRGIAQRLGLSYGAFSVLYTLSREGGCTQKRVCDLFLLSKQTVHSAVQTLQRDGLVAYESAGDDAGHRGLRIVLTEAGRERVAQGVDQIAPSERHAFGRLDEDEQRAIVRINRKWADALREELGAIEPGCKGQGIGSGETRGAGE